MHPRAAACRIAILACALLQQAPVAAQTYSIGLLTTNGMATERTHRARLTSLPGALYLGITGDVPVRGTTGLTGGARVVFSPLQIEECLEQPCRRVTPWHWRPRLHSSLVEIPFWLIEPTVGIRQRAGAISLAGGYAAPIVMCPYAFCGAAPMLVHAGWGELRGSVRVGGVRAGIEAGLTVIPPQAARWTTISEWTGYKPHGGDWPQGRSDPHTIWAYRVGLVIGGGR